MASHTYITNDAEEAALSTRATEAGKSSADYLSDRVAEVLASYVKRDAEEVEAELLANFRLANETKRQAAINAVTEE